MIADQNTAAPLRHSCSTRREGIGAIVVMLLTVVGLTAFPLITGAVFDELAGPWFWTGYFGIISIVAAAATLYGVLNLLAGRPFVCQIDDDFIECHAPRWCGDSFKIKIADIHTVEKMNSSESYSWYIVDHSGQRYWLTSNYCNPADEFIRAIHIRNKSVLMTET